jgi:type II pantothenate kinase
MSAPSLQPFVKLADPATYVACGWDLTADAGGRRHWVEFFKRHVNTILALGVAAATARGEDAPRAARRADACREEFARVFDAFAADPAAHGRVTILTLDDWRDSLLRRHGFVDAFIDLKNRENAKMLPCLPQVCAQIDACGDESLQLRAAVEGVFAGNIFDMGAEATARLFLGHAVDFFAVRRKLPPRPWRIDDLDAFTARVLGGRHRKCVFFIDNAGSDFLLGALPLVRWMARRGTRIVLAANERPTLNDMTIHDVNAWWPRIIEAEPSLAALPIERVSTGTGEPLIDLSAVSAELNAACADADLVILEGMGRGVESNLDARFACDALNIAMIKDEAVAGRIGGRMYDLVLRFR